MREEASASAGRGDAAAAIAELRARLGERLSTAAAVREQHGKDPTYHAGRAPDAVAFARSTEEVAEIVAVCARHGVPVIAFGTGTSLEGHIEALQGGVTIDLSGMDAILEVNAADLDCRVRGGGDADAAQHAPARHRALLPDRPGGGRLARRHGGDAGERDERGALRHHARGGAGADGGDRRRARWSGPAGGRASRRRGTT